MDEHLQFVQLTFLKSLIWSGKNPLSSFWQPPLGKDPATKSDEVLEKCQMGGGGEHFQ